MVFFLVGCCARVFRWLCFVFFGGMLPRPPPNPNYRLRVSLGRAWLEDTPNKEILEEADSCIGDRLMGGLSFILD